MRDQAILPRAVPRAARSEARNSDPRPSPARPEAESTSLVGTRPSFTATELAAHASVIAREAEVRGGELLKVMALKGGDRGGGRPGKTKGAKVPLVSPLASLGLTPSESKRMHAAASVPEGVLGSEIRCLPGNSRGVSAHFRAAGTVARLSLIHI